MSFPVHPGVFVAGLDLGKVGDPSALAIVEYVDLPLGDAVRRPFRRDLLDIQRLPLGMSYVDQIEIVAEVVRPLGDACRVVFDRTGGGVVAADLFREAKANGLFARWPHGVAISGGETAASEDSISKVDLVRNLQEAVANGRLRYPPGLPMVEETIAEAMSFKPEMTRIRKWLTFNAVSGAHDDLLSALAFACWSKFANRGGRRYIDSTGKVWASFEIAVAHIGALAQ
jgi:hypothetical protein